MNDASSLLKTYYETIQKERDLKWKYDCHPARSKKDKERKLGFWREHSDTRDARYALEETIESFIMTRIPG